MNGAHHPATFEPKPMGGNSVKAHSAEILDGQPELLRVAKVAKLLGIGRATAYRYAAAGELPTLRLGDSTYVVTAKLREMLAGNDGVAA